MSLPIKATLVTCEGFSKSIDLVRLEPVIFIPKMPKMMPVTDVVDIETSPVESTYYRMEFYLEKYKEVKQKKGLHHIVAVYRER